MKTPAQPQQLSRVQIREVLHRHNGSIKEIAAELRPRPVTTQAVSLWLRGKSTSARIAAAAQIKAQKLLEQERTAAADTSAHEELKRTA